MSSLKTTFVDLNIPIGPQCQQVCEAAIKLGYKILAINTPVLAKNCTAGGKNGSSAPSDSGGGGESMSKKAGRKRKWEERSSGIVASTAASLGRTTGKGQEGGVPTPCTTANWIANLTASSAKTDCSSSNYNGEIRILQRLTIIFDSIKELQNALNNPNTSKYDILAVIPTNNEALLTCLTTVSLNFDIITFDFEGPHWIDKIRINRPKGQLADSRDIVFELSYAAAFHGETALENLIFATTALLEEVCVKKIKNLIISSGASSALQLRAPKDLVSLAFLTGLDETTTRHCIRDYAYRVVNKAEWRKHGKTSVIFIPANKSGLVLEQAAAPTVAEVAETSPSPS